MREFLARHTRIDRLVLFRNLTLFPDAPGQHNLVVVGERVTDPLDEDSTRPTEAAARPQVSLYVGPARPETRAPSLEAIVAGRNAPATALVRTFGSQRNAT